MSDDDNRQKRFRFHKDDEILLLRLVLSAEPCPYLVNTRDGAIMVAWNNITSDFHAQCTHRPDGILPMPKTCRARCDKMLSDYLAARTNPNTKYKRVSREDMVKHELLGKLALTLGKVADIEEPVYTANDPIHTANNAPQQSESGSGLAVPKLPSSSSSSSAMVPPPSSSSQAKEQFEQRSNAGYSGMVSNNTNMGSPTSTRHTRSSDKGKTVTRGEISSSSASSKRKSSTVETGLLDMRMSSTPKKQRQSQQHQHTPKNHTSSSSRSARTGRSHKQGRGEESESDDEDDDEGDRNTTHITTGFDDKDDAYDNYDDVEDEDESANEVALALSAFNSSAKDFERRAAWTSPETKRINNVIRNGGSIGASNGHGPSSPSFSSALSPPSSSSKRMQGGQVPLSQMNADDRDYMLRTLALEEHKIKVEIDRIALEREKLVLERARLQWEMSGHK
ncbi:hypothetical protein BGZ74_002743 [Mortierella antarctica]|nr:hypothetical protein BGZ74_002743 [Mortierella antarctica]